MIDDIVSRLRYKQQQREPWDMNKEPIFGEAADEIERLRAALALAVGELSTHGEYTAWTPEMLMNQFVKEARRG